MKLCEAMDHKAVSLLVLISRRDTSLLQFANMSDYQIIQLPKEIIEIILRHLAAKDILTLSISNKHIFKTVNNSFYHTLYLKVQDCTIYDNIYLFEKVSWYKSFDYLSLDFETGIKDHTQSPTISGECFKVSCIVEQKS
jgi:hypothetical protein